MENFSIDVDGDGIALITWDMPGRSMNVISQSAIADMAEWVKRVAADDGIKGAVLTSGKDAFCAGADLEEMGASLGGGQNGSGGSKEAQLQAAFEKVYALNALLRSLETCGKPVAAAINGTALGGGMEVTLACHYRIVADDPKIQLGQPECKIGLIPGGGGTQRLPRLIGVANAGPLLLEGSSLRPADALQKGIVNKVAAAGDIVSLAKKWVKTEGDPVQPWDKEGYRIPGGGPHNPKGAQNFIVGNAMLHAKTYGNYPAQQYIMQAVYEGLQLPMDQALRVESKYFLKTLMTPEAHNMVRTLFLSSQELNKGARRPKDIDRTDVKKLGVLGAGMMGAGIAYVSASVGIEVILIDTSQENAERGKQYSAQVMDKRIKKGRGTEERKKEILDLITPTTDYQHLEGVDLIIEAVFEDREIKADVTAKAEAVIPESSTFGSNTSTLPISGLAEKSSRPDKFIGIHFFSPVDRMPLVEIIMGKETKQQALAVALDYVRKIKKTPIVVNDSRGFYTSRCFSTYVSEGVTMLAEGVKPALIENVGKQTGMPVPPLAMNDEVQLELSYHIMEQTRKDLGDAYKKTPAHEVTETMVKDLGRLGKKNRKGFYDYPEGGVKHLWPELTEHWPTDAQQPDVAEIRKRLIYIQALETARCFEEGVLTDVRDADVGAIFGWGFAPYTGGPLSLIDTLGTRAFVAECERMAKAYGDRFKPNALLRDMAETDDRFYKRFKPNKTDAAAA